MTMGERKFENVGSIENNKTQKTSITGVKEFAKYEGFFTNIACRARKLQSTKAST